MSSYSNGGSGGGGGGGVTTTSQTTTYSAPAGTGELVVLCNGTFTVTLPAASSGTNQLFTVKNIGTGVITVEASSGDIDGASSFVNSLELQSNSFVSDGTNYWIT